jgi:hypothetical protein
MRITFGRGNARQSVVIAAMAARKADDHADAERLGANILERTMSPQDKLRRKGFNVYAD